jgi:small-conductance mechanosensitive channel
MRWRLAVAVLLLACASAGFAADKKSATALPEVPETLSPAEADALLAKLTDAQARALLARELKTRAKKEADASAGEAPQGLGPLLMGLAHRLESEQFDFSGRTRVLGEGFAQLPASVASGASGIAPHLSILAFVLLAAAFASWIVRRALRFRGLAPVIAATEPASARVSAGALRFGLDLLPSLAFALVALAVGHAATAVGTAQRSVIIVYVTGAILVSALGVLLRLGLAPMQPALRPLPVGDEAARFLYRWLLALGGITLFGILSAQLIVENGVPVEAGRVVTVLGGTLITLTLLFMILTAPLSPLWRGLAAVYAVGVAGFWMVGVLDGHPTRAGAVAASLAILLVFPLLDRWVGRAIDDLAGVSAVPLRWAMRVLIAVLLVGAANEVWDFRYFEWQASLRQTLVGASFDLVAAFAVAVLGWQFIKIAIDRRLQPREVNGQRVGPSTRLQTLLPLARVFLVTALIASTVMLILSGLGVNIGPLLAGAGILGLAIGFGAQTLVRDIITGVFLILDDAFRVGEYIQSGNYKGTVESIGLRSVKLRHHRGPIFVVPFGELRGVQNLVRDWVIHKFTIGITYDSDLEKARKLVKKIGQQLAEDPEYKDTILEPLKMQGVEAFGDFAIQVRIKMMTRPGDKQFGLKRRAYAMIKKTFDENGIKFAFPTVQIAGGGGDAATIAAAATRTPAFKDGTAAA